MTATTSFISLKNDSSALSRLGIGTVQFGLNYGISNKIGRTPLHEVQRILNTAYEAGVRVLDTAPLYGDSERVLGEVLSPQTNFRIVTKTPKFSALGSLSEKIALLRSSLQESLNRLRRPHVDSILFHDSNDLLSSEGKALFQELEDFRAQGKIKKIGASVYTGDQIDRLLGQYPIDIVQLPLNVFDQRLKKTGHLRQLKAKGIEIHCRSAFLQGALLMNPKDLPPHLEPIQDRLTEFHRKAQQLGCTPLQACLGFTCSIFDLDAIICGVNNHSQMEEIIEGFKVQIEPETFSEFSVDDPSIVDPSKWPSIKKTS
jgi:aryl-alcohol dehydrogenase-like predicted oxidoreductase